MVESGIRFSRGGIRGLIKEVQGGKNLSRWTVLLVNLVLEWLAMINESPASRFANCGNLFSPLDFLLGTRGLPPSPGGFPSHLEPGEECLDR